MKPSDFLAELGRPLSDQAVLVGMLAFLAIFSLAKAAGLLGLWLGIVAVPAFCRFLVRVSQARIVERRVEPMDIELFNPINNIWALLPLVLVGLAGLAGTALVETQGFVVAAVFMLLFILVLPASLGALGLAQSPVVALNPAALWELGRRSGPAYLLVPATVISGALITLWLAQLGVPGGLLSAIYVYVAVLMFSLTGSIVARSGIRESVGIPDAEAQSPENEALGIVQSRKIVLNHAYGLFSRGNGEGGLEHIDGFISQLSHDRDEIDEYEWFFQRALEWETNLPGLLLGQRYIEVLLDASEPQRALKVFSRCLHEDSRFRPRPPVRARLREAAESAGREDLGAELQP